MEKCKHEWEEDKLFKNGDVIMLFGNMNNIKRESRFICKKCGEVDFR